MILKSRIGISICLAIAAILLFLGSCYLFFPIQRVNALVDQNLETQGLKLTPGAHKTILPGLAWDKPSLASLQGELLRFERFVMSPHWSSLLAGRIALAGQADLGSGDIRFVYGLTGSQVLKLKLDSVKLGAIPFFKTVLGARAGGNLWSEGLVTRNSKGLSGELKLAIQQLEFSGVKLGAFPLPDVSGLNSQGMLKIVNGRARLESFSLQGDGIYMRVSGELPVGANAANVPLDLVLEIMPKPEFLEKQKLVFMLLLKFMTSPGVYRVPIKGTLLKPEIL